MNITEELLLKDNPCKLTFTQYETKQLMRFRIVRWKDNEYQVQREYGETIKKRGWYSCNTDGTLRVNPTTKEIIAKELAVFETYEEAKKCIFDIEKYPIYY